MSKKSNLRTNARLLCVSKTLFQTIILYDPAITIESVKWHLSDHTHAHYFHKELSHSITWETPIAYVNAVCQNNWLEPLQRYLEEHRGFPVNGRLECLHRTAYITWYYEGDISDFKL